MAMTRMLAAETDFGLEMLRQAPLAHSCVISPISVLMALTMVQMGSKGRTKMQINNAIAKDVSDDDIVNHFSDLSTEIGKESEELYSRIANGLFVSEKYGLKEEYRKSVEQKLAASVKAVNFGEARKSAKTINDFVHTNTGGKIKDFIRESSLRDATAFIVNAIYFHDAWEHKFPKNKTTKAQFFSAENEAMEIDFMRTKGKRAYAEDDEIQVLSLEYTDPAYAMNIFLPKKRFGLNELLTKIDGKRIQNLLSRLNKWFSISIKIPKMKLETDFNLKEALISMGITDLFSGNADLTGITESNQNLMVSGASHKAIIEMDEESTTAAAATALKLKFKSLTKNIDFVADHAFLFVLTKSGHPLFIGKFTNE